MAKKSPVKTKKKSKENVSEKKITDYMDCARTIVADAITYFLPEAAAMSRGASLAAGFKHCDEQIKEMAIMLWLDTSEKEVRIWFMLYLMTPRQE